MPKLQHCLKKGYVVHIEMTHYPEGDPKRSFDAKITEVIEDIEQGFQITYDRLDDYSDDHPPSCSATWVTHIIEAPPYRCEYVRKVNPFAGRSFYVESHGGVKIGFFQELLSLSLSKYDIDFVRWFDEDKALALYAKASHPGTTSFPLDPFWKEHGMIAVRWKAFHRWVGANLNNFFWSKQRMLQEIKRQNRKMYEEDMDYFYGDDEGPEESVEPFDTFLEGGIG